MLALLLVVSGTWLFSRSYTAFNDADSFNSQGDYIALQSGITTAPLMIILGVVIAVGITFVFAVRWRPRS